MEQLWRSDTPLTANDVRDRLIDPETPSRAPATTTVLTVLSRLERKGFVARARETRPHRYHALLTRAEHTAELMHEVLASSSDRDAALARFVGSVSAGEANTLRRLLDELVRH